MDLNDPIIQAALEQLEAETKAKKDDSRWGTRSAKEVMLELKSALSQRSK